MAHATLPCALYSRGFESTMHVSQLPRLRQLRRLDAMQHADARDAFADTTENEGAREPEQYL